MATKDPRFFLPITRVDDEERTVEAYGMRGDIKDTYGTYIDLDSAVKCMAEYMEFPAIRAMHQPIAAGKAVDYEVDDKGIKITAKVVDDDAWKKVKEQVYRGFSIGASQDYTIRDGKSVGRIASANWKDGDTIVLKGITEYSLVDSPSNRGCGDLVYRISGLPNDKENDMEVERAEALATVTRYAGEEISDTQSACYALSSIQSLLNKEQGEAEIAPDQIDALKAAIDAIKKFIVSEIQEDTSGEKVMAYWSAVADFCRADETKEGAVKRMAELGFVPAETVERVDEADVERKGAAISAGNLKRVQEIADHAHALGAVCKCGGSDVQKAAEADVQREAEPEVTRAEETTDIQRLAAIEENVQRLSGLVETLTTAKETLVNRIAELEAQPEPAKGVLRVVERGDDVGTTSEPTQEEQEAAEVKRLAALTPEQQSLELLKMVHKTGAR